MKLEKIKKIKVNWSLKEKETIRELSFSESVYIVLT